MLCVVFFAFSIAFLLFFFLRFSLLYFFRKIQKIFLESFGIFLSVCSAFFSSITLLVVFSSNFVFFYGFFVSICCAQLKKMSNTNMNTIVQIHIHIVHIHIDRIIELSRCLAALYTYIHTDTYIQLILSFSVQKNIYSSLFTNIFSFLLDFSIHFAVWRIIKKKKEIHFGFTKLFILLRCVCVCVVCAGALT